MTTERQKQLAADAVAKLANPKPGAQLPPVVPSDAAKEKAKARMVAKAQGQGPTQPQTVQEFFQDPRTQHAMRAVLPAHLKPDRMMRIALAALRADGKLAQCDTETFVRSVLEASMLGLELNNPLGLAYLVPFKKVCTLIIGYKGLTKLAYQSGLVAAINAHLVYKGEPFRHVCGTTELIEHEPALHLKDRGPLVGGYGIAWIKGGLPIARYMPADEINAARPWHATKADSPWVTALAEMQLKTCLRRTLKYAPLSPELNRAIVADESAERGEAPDPLGLPEARDDDPPADPPGDE